MGRIVFMKLKDDQAYTEPKSNKFQKQCSDCRFTFGFDFVWKRGFVPCTVSLFLCCTKFDTAVFSVSCSVHMVVPSVILKDMMRSSE